MTVHILEDSKSFQSSIKDAKDDKLIVLDCFATWCGPCKAIAPVIASLSNEHEDVGFYKIDVDNVPDVAQELGVRAMPTFFFFKNGEEIKQVVGANPQAIKSAIDSFKAQS